MKRWLPRAGWRDLTPWEAMDLGLEQAGRFAWQVFDVEWLGIGISIRARIKP